jgi:hypothetical protein
MNFGIGGGGAVVRVGIDGARLADVDVAMVLGGADRLRENEGIVEAAVVPFSDIVGIPKENFDVGLVVETDGVGN